MIKFNKSYAISKIRAITWVIFVCIFALSLLPLTAAAQGITAKELDKKKDEYRNAEGALDNGKANISFHLRAGNSPRSYIQPDTAMCRTQ